MYLGVSLSVLWRVFGKYWICVLGKVSLSVLRRVLGEYGMGVFGKVSLSVLWGYRMNI